MCLNFHVAPNKTTTTFHGANQDNWTETGDSRHTRARLRQRYLGLQVLCQIVLSSISDFPGLSFGPSPRFRPAFYDPAPVIGLVLGLFLPLPLPCLHLFGLQSFSVLVVGFSGRIIPCLNSQLSVSRRLLFVSNKRNSLLNSVAACCFWVQFPKLE